MLYDDKCYKCLHRVSKIEPEIEKAKEFYKKNNVAWKFECGAMYYPPISNSLGVEIYPKKCMLDKDNKINLQGLV